MQLWQVLSAPGARVAPTIRRMVEQFCRAAPTLCWPALKEDGPSWEAVLAIEPRPTPGGYLTEAQLDTACLAMADFADIKSPFTAGHSRAVSRWRPRRPARAGLPATRHRPISGRAGVLHDIGQSAISARIWTKPGPLTRQRMGGGAAASLLRRAHPVPVAGTGAAGRAGRRASRAAGWLGLSSRRAAPARTAGAHPGRRRSLSRHDRGSPHRPALRPSGRPPSSSARRARAALDGDAVAAVLAAAGHAVQLGRALVGGIDRARDRSAAARRARPVDEGDRPPHSASRPRPSTTISSTSTKIEVKTRAGATLFAIEHGIVDFGS